MFLYPPTTHRSLFSKRDTGKYVCSRPQPLACFLGAQQGFVARGWGRDRAARGEGGSERGTCGGAGTTWKRRCPEQASRARCTLAGLGYRSPRRCAHTPPLPHSPGRETETRAARGRGEQAEPLAQGHLDSGRAVRTRGPAGSGARAITPASGGRA